MPGIFVFVFVCLFVCLFFFFGGGDIENVYIGGKILKFKLPMLTEFLN